MKNTMTVRLPEDIRSELRRISRSESVPVSDLVRASIRQYVALRKFRRIRGKILPFAEAQGLLTDEDIFKAFS